MLDPPFPSALTLGSSSCDASRTVTIPALLWCSCFPSPFVHILSCNSQLARGAGHNRPISGLLPSFYANSLRQMNSLFSGHPAGQWVGGSLLTPQTNLIVQPPSKEGFGLASPRSNRSVILGFAGTKPKLQKHVKGNFTGKLERKGSPWKSAFSRGDFRSAARRQQAGSLLPVAVPLASR